MRQINKQRTEMNLTSPPEADPPRAEKTEQKLSIQFSKGIYSPSRFFRRNRE